MPEETEDTFISDVVANATGQPQTAAQPEQPTEEPEEEPEAADAEGESEEDPDEDEPPEDEEPKEPAGNKYKDITDVGKLQRMLKWKDAGYAKVEEFVKTGQALANLLAMPESDPNRAEGLKFFAEYVGITPKEPEKKATAPEFKEPEWGEDDEGKEAKSYFDKVVKGYVEHRLGPLETENQALRSELSALKSEVSEPLSQYKGSREQAMFDARVEAEFAQASRLFKLRTQGDEIDKDFLGEAMKRYQNETPVEAAIALAALKVTRPPKKETEKRGPGIVKASERKEAKVIDPFANPDGAMSDSINRALSKHFGGQA